MSSQAVSAAFEDELVRPISRLNGAIAQHTGRQCLHKTRTLIELHKDGVLPESFSWTTVVMRSVRVPCPRSQDPCHPQW